MHHLHSQDSTYLFTLGGILSALIADEATPKTLRRRLVKFTRKLRKKLPPIALREVEAAEAEAVIRAADYLRYDKRSVS